jgi:hypothetical protein
MFIMEIKRINILKDAQSFFGCCLNWFQLSSPKLSDPLLVFLLSVEQASRGRLCQMREKGGAETAARKGI